jgi:hypothetical protein
MVDRDPVALACLLTSYILVKIKLVNPIAIAWAIRGCFRTIPP